MYMSDEFNIWYYIKDFTCFNKLHNKHFLPIELTHYIYSFILYDMQRIINNNYIKHSVNEKINELNQNVIRNNIINSFRQSNEIRVYLKDLPYQVTTLNELHDTIDGLLKYKGYYYKYYRYEGEVIVYEKATQNNTLTI